MAAPGEPIGAPVALPPVDSLTFESDFTAFMQPGVDEAVRREALKKLLHHPHFNEMDGLDAFTDDYTKPSPLAPSVVKQLAHARAVLNPPRTRINAQGWVEDVIDEVPSSDAEAPDAAAAAAAAAAPDDVAAAADAAAPDGAAGTTAADAESDAEARPVATPLPPQPPTRPRDPDHLDPAHHAPQGDVPASVRATSTSADAHDASAAGSGTPAAPVRLVRSPSECS